MIDNKWGQGVPYISPIDLGAPKPLDSRAVVNTLAERDAFVTKGIAYEGMHVYVAEEGIEYLYTADGWKVIKQVEVVDSSDSSETDKALSANQGRLLNEKIDSVAAGQIKVPVASTSEVGGIKSASVEGGEIGAVYVDAEGYAKVYNTSNASKLSTPVDISLSGDVEGTVSFDGSKSVNIEVVVKDDSHAHTKNTITGLQDALDAKADLDSPIFTGTPSAPTAPLNDSSTQIANTSFVKKAIENSLVEMGNVAGPSSAVDGNIAVFDGTQGEAIKDSGKSIADLTKVATSTDSGLMSAEDFNKLEGIQEQAEKNIIEIIKLNGSAVTVDSDRSVNIDLKDYSTTNEIEEYIKNVMDASENEIAAYIRGKESDSSSELTLYGVKNYATEVGEKAEENSTALYNTIDSVENTDIENLFS